jgi:hypothetical protein
VGCVLEVAEAHVVQIGKIVEAGQVQFRHRIAAAVDDVLAFGQETFNVFLVRDDWLGFFTFTKIVSPVNGVVDFLEAESSEFHMLSWTLARRSVHLFGDRQGFILGQITEIEFDRRAAFLALRSNNHNVVPFFDLGCYAFRNSESYCSLNWGCRRNSSSETYQGLNGSCSPLFL